VAILDFLNMYVSLVYLLSEVVMSRLERFIIVKVETSIRIIPTTQASGQHTTHYETGRKFNFFSLICKFCTNKDTKFTKPQII